MKPKKTFEVGDKVFAKVKGYPAWPARVEAINNKKYSVYFYGTGETATVKVEDLSLYVDHRHQYIKKFKRKEYKDAVSQIEHALLEENNITLEPIDDTTITTNTPEKRGQKRQLDSTEKENAEEVTVSNKKVKTSVVNSVTSRSGRQIKLKRFSEEPEAEVVSDQGTESVNEITEEEEISPSPEDVKSLRIIPIYQIKALIEHGEKMLKNHALKKVLMNKKKPAKTNIDLIEIVLATLDNGKLVGIRYKEDKKKIPKNVWELWEEETKLNKDILDKKTKLENGEIKPEDYPNLYIPDLNITKKEIITATEIQMHERKKAKLNYIRQQDKLLHLESVIKCSLGLENAEPEKALDALKEMSELQIDELMLKKHQHVLDVIRRLRRYIGNAKEWNLSEAQLQEFEEKASAIRKQSDLLYDKFRTLFVIPDDKNFLVVFNERMVEFRNFTNEMSSKQIISLFGEPYSKEAFLHQLDAEQNTAGRGNKSSEEEPEYSPTNNLSAATTFTNSEESITESQQVEKENSSQVANLPQSPSQEATADRDS